MTLQSSGQIALSDLRTEYTNLGTRARVAMNEFYYGSKHLPNNGCTDRVYSDSAHPGYSSHFQGIPTAGTSIKLSNFYSKVYYYARKTPVRIDGTEVRLNPVPIENEAIKGESINSAFFDIETSGNCSSNTTSAYALIITESSRPYTTCLLTNDHAIYGKGGNGARGGFGGGNSGAPGGSALRFNIHSYLRNNNRILGGGGGGAGSNSRRQNYNECYCCNETNAAIGGSGGGGGKGGGAGGDRGDILGANFQYSGGVGNAGDSDTSSVPGSGGSGGGSCSYNNVLGTFCALGGGAGGGWGQAGGGASGGGSGGSGGNAVHYYNVKRHVVVTTGIVAGSTAAKAIDDTSNS